MCPTLWPPEACDMADIHSFAEVTRSIATPIITTRETSEANAFEDGACLPFRLMWEGNLQQEKRDAPIFYALHDFPGKVEEFFNMREQHTLAKINVIQCTAGLEKNT